jgi:hypothetical protein
MTICPTIFINEMKLYPVTITYSTMVVAENPHSAECVAQHNLTSIFEDEPDDVVVQNAIEEEEDLPPEWVTAIPYGENNDLRCNEIVRMGDKDKYIKSLTKEQMNKILSNLTVEEISKLLKK